MQQYVQRKKAQCLKDDRFARCKLEVLFIINSGAIMNDHTLDVMLDGGEE